MSDRTTDWRDDIRSGDTDRLLNAAYEAIEMIESIEQTLEDGVLGSPQKVSAIKETISPAPFKAPPAPKHEPQF